jgi:hypothetical protein
MESELQSAQTPTKRRHLIIRHWQGGAQLWQSYWLVGVLGGWVFWTIIFNLVEHFGLPELAAAIILIGYSIYAALGIWRSAFNVKWIGWAYIARAIIVMSAIFFIFELI